MRKNKFPVLSACVLTACLVAPLTLPAQDNSDWELDSIDGESAPAGSSSQSLDDELSLDDAESVANSIETANDKDKKAKSESVPEPQIEELAPAAPEAVPAPVVSEPTFAASSPSDDPDYTKENRFHLIYKKFNEAPTSVEAWEKALGTRKSENYQVQKGDTLWDISSTLFGDSYFWPKVWSLNKGSILNPHEINPGLAIQFFAGNATDAPTLQLASADALEKENKEGDTSIVDTSNGTQEVVTIPAPKKRAALLKKLPNSFPTIEVAAVAATARTQIQIELPKNRFPTAPEHLGYYLADNKVASTGTVTGTESDSQTAAEFQYVYVTFHTAPEKNYVIYRNLNQIDDSQHRRKGQMVEYQGELEVLEKVNSEKNIYRALVTKTITPIDVGASLLPGRVPMIDPTPTTPSAASGGRIIGGQFQKERSLFGATALIFLDAGASSGLQVGQSLNIFADEKLRNKKTPIEVNDRVIGVAKIVQVSNGFATAYVTRAMTDILPGDMVGKVLQSSASAGGSVEDAFSDEDLETSGDLDKELDSLENSPAPADSGLDEGELEL